MTRLLIALLVIAICPKAASAAEAGQTLADYLQEHPWDPAKRGPMLVVEAKATKVLNDNGGLDSFGRMTVACGSITAIVPTEMVTIDDSLKDPPNLYDGLPLNQKILYLMSTLSSDQWKTAGAQGIGSGDLGGEQRAVFDSIVPKNFRWTNYTVANANGMEPAGDESLSPDQRSGVRIHFFHRLGLGARLSNSGGTTGVTIQFSDRHPFGETVAMRDKSDEAESDSLFGVQIRKTEPNKLKPSDLKYDGDDLAQQITLPHHASINALLKLVSESSGIAVVADVRVGSRTVEAYGSVAKAGDALKALALAVSGTYRKVGSTFELTSDLEGMGARKLKIGIWAAQVEQTTLQRATEWRRAIAEGQGGKRLGYLSGDSLTPNDAMRDWMSEDENSRNRTGVDLASLPQSLQSIVQREAGRVASTQPIQIDHVTPQESTSWNFVLPDGRALLPEDDLGPVGSGPVRPATDWRATTVKPIFPQFLVPATPGALAVRINDGETAVKATALAKDHGFSELWVQTTDPNVLATAIESAQKLGLGVRLLVRPWEAGPKDRVLDEDRTILGEAAPQAALRRGTNAGVVELRRVPMMTAVPMVGPSDSSIKLRWANISALSATPGLSGGVLCETQPTGYEPHRTRLLDGVYSRELAFSLGLGYSTANREAFLKKWHVDPIDITDILYSLDSPRGPSPDLSQPFFSYDYEQIDHSQHHDSEPFGIQPKWDAFRAKANSEAIKELASSLTGPVLIEGRILSKEVAPVAPVALIPWQAGTELPTLEDPKVPEFVPQPGSTMLVRTWPAMSARVASGVWNDMHVALKSNPGPLAIDLTSVPADQWETLLDTWFFKAAPQNTVAQASRLRKS